MDYMSTPSSYNPVINWLRGIAAVLVVLNHSRALIFLPHSAEQSNIVESAFYLISGFGHQAVILFFTLSGYLVAKICSERYHHRIQILDYSCDRVIRLTVVLFPALAVTYLLDRLGSVYAISQESYSGREFSVLHTGPDIDIRNMGANVYIGNALFLQGILVPVAGSNSPLWSLAYEFWYYALYVPLRILQEGEESTPMRILLASIVAVLIIMLLPTEFIRSFPYWLAGVAAYHIKCRLDSLTKRHQMLFTISLMLLIVAICAARIRLIQGWPSDLMVSVAVAHFLVFSDFGNWNVRGISPWSKFASHLGHISYSLYLIHFPVIFFCYSVFIGERGRRHANLTSILTLTLVLALAFIFSELMYALFERNTKKINKSIKKAFIDG